MVGITPKRYREMRADVSSQISVIPNDVNANSAKSSATAAA
jgi:hypothetical protein